MPRFLDRTRRHPPRKFAAPLRFVTGLLSAGAAILLLAACEADQPPSDSWTLAAQGLFSGAISDNGQYTVVGSLNHGASMWRTKDRERLFNWAHQNGEYVDLVAADFSPDGNRAVTSDPRTLVLWNTSSGQALNYWTTPGAVLDVAMLSDNRHVLIGLDDHSAVLFDAQSGAYEMTLLHQGQVGAVAIDADSEFALTGSDDETAVLWSLNDGKALQTYQHSNPVRSVALSSQGTYAFTAAQSDLVAIWNNASGQKLHELHSGVNHGVVTARFSTDERLLAIGYTNQQIALYEVASGRLLQRWNPGTRHPMRASGSTILEVAFSNNDATLYALAGDGRLLQFNRS